MYFSCRNQHGEVMTTEQVQVMVYAMAYNGGTVNNFAQGDNYNGTPKRTRKSALELINRTARCLGLPEDGASSLIKIAHISRQILEQAQRKDNS